MASKAKSKAAPIHPIVHQPIYELSLELLEAVNPSMNPPWNGMDFDYSPITLDEVKESEAVSKPLKGETCFRLSQMNGRDDHAGRIRWLIENGWSDPIKIDLTCYIWPIVDGNHRLAAAFFQNHKTIKAIVTGESQEHVQRFLSGEFKLESMV